MLPLTLKNNPFQCHGPPSQTSPIFQQVWFSHPKSTALGDSCAKTFEDILSVFTLLENLQNEAL